MQYELDSILQLQALQIMRYLGYSQFSSCYNKGLIAVFSAGYEFEILLKLCLIKIADFLWEN
jgi:hypothetical protein